MQQKKEIVCVSAWVSYKFYLVNSKVMEISKEYDKPGKGRKSLSINLLFVSYISKKKRIV